MKCIKIEPHTLRGKLDIPSSKSLCHRAIISASLSAGVSKIENIIFSEDIDATCIGMRKFGASMEKVNDDSLLIKGSSTINLNEETIDCSESGSTLRFLIPIALSQHNKVKFAGRGKLVSRPLDVYYRMFNGQGIFYTNNEGKLPLTIEGQLKPGAYDIEGNISSQFITGLLFALPLLDGDSKINIITNLESKGYVDLTIDILEKFGIKIINNNYKEFIIKGNQKYIARDYRVEGDFSQAAFWLVGGVLGEEIICNDLNNYSLQGDKRIIDIIKQMGGKLNLDNESIRASISSTRGITIDASQSPDLVPILTVLAALSKGETRIINAARLRIKESDRLKAISSELNKLGADVVEEGEGLIINGKESLEGGIVDSWNDHRIAMSLAIASVKCKNQVIITNSDVVKKSYPQFWEDFKKLGGNVNEFNMGE